MLVLFHKYGNFCGHGYEHGKSFMVVWIFFCVGNGFSFFVGHEKILLDVGKKILDIEKFFVGPEILVGKFFLLT